MKRAMIPVRLLVGGVLILAGVSKLGDPWAFAEQIANYRMLPASANQVLAVLLPWWELAAGLLIGLGVWVRPAALLSASLFLAFGVAVATAMAQGLDVECGCFGTGASGRVGVRPLLVDVLGLGLSIAVCLSERPRETPPLQPAR